MSSSFEKSVKGATKIKNAPPKTKYIEHILIATHQGEAGVAEIFRALQLRLHDSTWTVVFKSLITVHLMIREGSPDATLAYLSRHRNLLSIRSYTDAQTQGRNIRHYADYLTERARAYKDTKTDWVRCKESRLENLSVNKGLLRETEVVQNQLTALLKCDVMDEGLDSEITIFVFRLLVLDLLALFQMLNQGLINILRHFFEMSKPDAERALNIYRTFIKQTDHVVQYLGVAKQYVHHTRVEVPKLKHAPVNLGRQLEEYLNDPDFEINRRQYLAEMEAKKSGKGGGGGGASSSSRANKAEPSKTTSTSKANATNGSQAASKPTQQAKGPEPDLIDLIFDSIEQPQTSQVPVAAQPQMGQQFTANSPYQVQSNMTGYQANGLGPQPTGFSATNPFQLQQQQQQHQQQQSMNPYGQLGQQQQPQQLTPAYTGAGFGGYTPQPTFQPGSLGTIPQDSMANFQQANLSPQPQQAAQALQPQATGTNPFRQSMLMAQPTGAPATQLSRQNTNPFNRSSPPAAQPFSPASASPFQSPSPASTQPPAAPPLQAQATGTNPFMRGYAGGTPPGQNPTAAPLAPQATGTNPFRQQPVGANATGWGGQSNNILTQMETVPVFPRPGQQQQAGFQ